MHIVLNLLAHFIFVYATLMVIYLIGTAVTGGLDGNLPLYAAIIVCSFGLAEFLKVYADRQKRRCHKSSI